MNLLRVITNGTIATGVLLYLNFYFYGNDNQNKCWERFSEEECNVHVYDTFQLLSRPCEWKLQGLRSKPNCVLSDPNITWNSMILLALLALIVMSFFKICLNYVYDYHLFTQDQIELSNEMKVLPDTVEISEEFSFSRQLDALVDKIMISIAPEACCEPNIHTFKENLNNLIVSNQENYDTDLLLRSWGCESNLSNQNETIFKLYSPRMKFSLLKFQKVLPDTISVESLIEKTINKVIKQAEQYSKCIRKLDRDDKIAAVFVLFCLDLIGPETSTGKYFKTNFVTCKFLSIPKKAKKLIVGFLILLNCLIVIASFFLTYKHVSDGANIWIYSWLYGSIFMIQADALTLSRIRGLVLDCYIPYLIKESIHSLRLDLVNIHLNLLQKMENSEFIHHLNSFSLSNYLFMSDILVSSSNDSHVDSFTKFFIKYYKSVFPLSFIDTWGQDMVNSENIFPENKPSKFPFLNIILLSFGSMSINIQKFIVEFFLIGSIIVFLYFTQAYFYYLPIIFFICYSTSVFASLLFNLHSNRKGSILATLFSHKENELRNVSDDYNTTKILDNEPDTNEKSNSSDHVIVRNHSTGESKAGTILTVHENGYDELRSPSNYHKATNLMNNEANIIEKFNHSDRVIVRNQSTGETKVGIIVDVHEHDSYDVYYIDSGLVGSNVDGSHINKQTIPENLGTSEQTKNREELDENNNNSGKTQQENIPKSSEYYTLSHATEDVVTVQTKEQDEYFSEYDSEYVSQQYEDSNYNSDDESNRESEYDSDYSSDKEIDYSEYDDSESWSDSGSGSGSSGSYSDSHHSL